MTDSLPPYDTQLESQEKTNLDTSEQFKKETEEFKDTNEEFQEETEPLKVESECDLTSECSELDVSEKSGNKACPRIVNLSIATTLTGMAIGMVLTLAMDRVLLQH